MTQDCTAKPDVSTLRISVRSTKQHRFIMGTAQKDKMQMIEQKTYRLGSAEFVHAPGLVKWAINGAKFKKDRKTLTNVIASTWSIPPDAALALITEKVPHTVDGETVVFVA